MAHKVLVIEDEPTLSRLLTYNLQQEGYETTSVEHGGEGLQQAIQHPYDLIILDLMLPGMSGFEVLSSLRSQGVSTPIIILTARNGEDEVVQGLRLGADDYMTKPFGVAELLARVSAVLRRTQADGSTSDKLMEDSNHISVGELRIFPEKYEVWVNEAPVSLRPKEFEVLLYLAQRPGVVITRDDLMNAVWGFDYIGGQRTVDVHVSSLRKKLELNQDFVQIEAIRGVGYKLAIHKHKPIKAT